MRLRLSKLALLDLEDIHEYTWDQWGEEQAARYSALIADALETIAREPERWSLRNDIYPGFQVCLSGKLAILYRSHGGQVEVSRVLHGAMDLARHVPSNFISE